MEALAAALLALIEEIGPATAAGGMVAKIIAALETLIPIMTQAVSNLVPIVKSVITALRSNSNVSSDQLDQLDAIEAKIDADFDADSAKAEAEERAIDGGAADASNGPASS